MFLTGDMCCDGKPYVDSEVRRENPLDSGSGGMKKYLHRSSRLSLRTLVSSVRLQLNRTVLIAVPQLVCTDLKSSCSDLDCKFTLYNVDDQNYSPILTADLRKKNVDLFLVVSFFGLNPNINVELVNDLRDIGKYLVLDGSHIDPSSSEKFLFDASFFSLYKKSCSVEGSYLFIDDRKIKVEGDLKTSKQRLIGFGLISCFTYLFCWLSRNFKFDSNYISLISKIISGNNCYPQIDYFSLANEIIFQKFSYRDEVDVSDLKIYISKKISGISVNGIIVLGRNPLFIVIRPITNEIISVNSKLLRKWGGCFWPDKNISDDVRHDANNSQDKVYVLYFQKVLVSYFRDRSGNQRVR